MTSRFLQEVPLFKKRKKKKVSFLRSVPRRFICSSVLKPVDVISTKWKRFLCLFVSCLSARRSLFHTKELMSDKSAVPHVRRGHMVLLLPFAVCGGKQRDKIKMFRCLEHSVLLDFREKPVRVTFSGKNLLGVKKRAEWSCEDFCSYSSWL